MYFDTSHSSEDQRQFPAHIKGFQAYIKGFPPHIKGSFRSHAKTMTSCEYYSRAEFMENKISLISIAYTECILRT